MCQYTKNLEQIFEILIFNFFLQIFEIVNLDLVSAAETEKLSSQKASLKIASSVSG